MGKYVDFNKHWKSHRAWNSLELSSSSREDGHRHDKPGPHDAEPRDLFGIGKVDRLTPLPLELLTEILQELDWLDVLRVRQVSQRFLYVSKQRSVWMALYHRYTATSQLPLHLEAPLNDYSALDMEHWLLRRIGADIGWTEDAETSSIVRSIEADGINTAYMVPGGRWLLAVTNNLEVRYYDLDKPNPSVGGLLIKGCSVRASNILISVDFVHDSHSGFNMAIYSENSTPKLVASTISIWSIRVYGLAPSRLTAKLLVQQQFPGNLSGATSISLCGNLFACTMPAPNIVRCVIIKWTLDDMYFWRKVIWGLWGHEAVMHLLPGNGAVVLSKDPRCQCGFVYDLSQIQPSKSNSVTWQATGTPPIWRMDLAEPDEMLQHFSIPFRRLTSTTFLYNIASTGIKRMTIPHDLSRPTDARKVCSLNNLWGLTHCYGLARALLVGVKGYLVTYPNQWGSGNWSECPQGKVAHISSMEESFFLITPLLDEETGRVVVVRRPRIIIADHGAYRPHQVE